MASSARAASPTDATSEEAVPTRRMLHYHHRPGDITYTVPRSMLETIVFEVDSSGEMIRARPVKKGGPTWPCRDLSRASDVLVAVDGKSALHFKDFPKIMLYMNTARNRQAYKLTFRLPLVTMDLALPMSSRLTHDTDTGNLHGYLCKLGQGTCFTKPQWKHRYFVLDVSRRLLLRYEHKSDSQGSTRNILRLDDMRRVTEAIPQPSPDAKSAAEREAADVAHSEFVVAFDVVLHSGKRRSFIASTPEDSRVWVATLAHLIGEPVLTDLPCAPLNSKRK